MERTPGQSSTSKRSLIGLDGLNFTMAGRPRWGGSVPLHLSERNSALAGRPNWHRHGREFDRGRRLPDPGGVDRGFYPGQTSAGCRVRVPGCDGVPLTRVDPEFLLRDGRANNSWGGLRNYPSVPSRSQFGLGRTPNVSGQS